jgi:hypothetical protein
MANKIPAFQFYPADWRKDPAVQSLSYHDKGIWFEILCLMHESEERGKLLLNGKPMPDEALARLLGLDKQILTKTLTKLLEYGVASRDEQGALFSRRMVRDETLRKIRTEAGKKGGNPNLVNQNSTKQKKQVNQNSTPSSSSSISSSEKEEIKDDGGSPNARAPANGNEKPPPPKFETLPEYLLRKQLEYPDRDVKAIHDDFVKKCGSDKYPNLKNTQRHFDKWLAEQDVEFEAKPTDWRKAIDECPRCDRRGLIQTEKGMQKCNHEPL